MTRVYYKYAIAALVVFDLTRPATFEAVTKVTSFSFLQLILVVER